MVAAGLNVGGRSLPVKQNGPIFRDMKRAALILAFGLLATSPAFAFRCGTKIVSEGDTRSKVAAICGEPDDVVNQRSVFRRPVIWTRGRPYYIGEDFIEIPVESWIYNLGPNKLMQRVRFEGGVVVEIESLGYGYNK
jgi:hypothetical protein